MVNMKDDKVCAVVKDVTNMIFNAALLRGNEIDQTFITVCWR